MSNFLISPTEKVWNLERGRSGTTLASFPRKDASTERLLMEDLERSWHHYLRKMLQQSGYFWRLLLFGYSLLDCSPLLTKSLKTFIAHHYWCPWLSPSFLGSFVSHHRDSVILVSQRLFRTIVRKSLVLNSAVQST
jgi:hypothetical protein